jgi:hypothetical protein
MGLKNITSAIDAALALIARGWSVVPIPTGGKNPVMGAWQNLRLGRVDVQSHFQPSDNIGILAGDASDGLIDVDLDACEAVQAAPTFLPQTGLAHGRPGNPNSHRWYRVRVPAVPTTQFEDTDGTMLAEIRSTGAQTVVPPSTHPSGERLEWTLDGDPANVDHADLRASVAALVICACLARHWPSQGSRHNAALAAAGFLLAGGIDEQLAKSIVSEAARIAGDTEWTDRGAAVVDTAARIARRETATGAPTLVSLLQGDGAKVVEKIRNWLNISSGSAQLNPHGLPEIDARDADLATVTPRAVAALQTTQDPHLFVYGTGVVRAQHGDAALELRPVQRDELFHELAHKVFWFKRERNGRRRVTPPAHVIRDVFGSPAVGFPRLTRVVQTPVFTATGLHTTEGYDSDTGLIYRPPPGFLLPQIPQNPTTVEIKEAVRWLRDELMGDFPFTGPADRANAIALQLLPFLRGLINGPTPLHALDKPTPGTGASLLVEVIGLVATGNPPAMLSEAMEAAEWGKRITAALLQSPALIVIDNVRRVLDSGDLAKALTARVYQGRILGESRLVDLPNEATWVATGNNVRLSGEITRRTIRIRMDANMEKPWDGRQFRHADLRGFADLNRATLVASVLTIGQAWIAAGRPKGGHSLGMFEDWEATVGGVLQVAGIPDFLGNQQALYDDANADAGPWTDFINEWWKRYRDRVVTVSEVWSIVDPANAGAIDFNLGAGGDRALQTKLGIRLRQARDRQFGSYKLVADGKSHSAQQWKLVPSGTVSNAATAPSVPPVILSASQFPTSVPTLGTNGLSTSSLNGAMSFGPVSSGLNHASSTTSSQPSAGPSAVSPPSPSAYSAGIAAATAHQSTPLTSQPGSEVPAGAPLTAAARQFLSGLGYTRAEIAKMRPADLAAVMRERLVALGFDDTAIHSMSWVEKRYRILTGQQVRRGT